MYRKLLLVNDLLWMATAVACVFYENALVTGVVIGTTVVYAVDLLIKFRGMGWRLGAFVRAYWLDILLLVPFVKIFRGLRILKVGRLLSVADSVCDFTEMLCRGVRFVRGHRATRESHEGPRGDATGA